MIAIILISFLALIGAVFTIYFWQRASSEETSNPVLSAPPFGGLFDRTEAETPAEDAATIESRRRELFDRARTGDLSALNEAYSAHKSEYSTVIDALVEWASERQENFDALVSHISKCNELRSNQQLATLVIEMWKEAPDRRSTTEMVHIAALSDDAKTYGQAIDAVLKVWRAGRLAKFSAEDIVELLVSQYWVIAPEARRGGVGFALKRRLLSIRRELTTAVPAR